MKAYGCRKGDELTDLGAPTRTGKLSSNNRRTARRLLHRQARNDNKRNLRHETANLKDD